MSSLILTSSIAWVTARAEDSVLTFSTHDPLDDPFNEPDRTTRRLPALLSTTPVGTAPVGIQLFDHDRLIAVANSNRFTPGGTGTVSILDYAKGSAVRAIPPLWEHSPPARSRGNGPYLPTAD